jgi:hypothetical protein
LALGLQVKFRWLPFSLFISLVSGFGLFFLFGRFISPGSGEGYAVLEAREDFSDASIRKCLEGLGPGFDSWTSESNQWVWCSDFGGLRKIALDRYREEVESIDPRDDGYAEKLRSSFVSQGKRRFYVPLEAVSSGGFAELKNKVLQALGDIPFSLYILGERNAGGGYFILFAAALLGMTLWTQNFLNLVIIGPAWVSFARGGSGGLALAAVLAALWALCRKVPAEGAGEPKPGKRRALQVPGTRLVPILWFTALYFVIVHIATLPLAPCALALAVFFPVRAAAAMAEAEKDGRSGSGRFIPVSILPPRLKTNGFFRYFFPFALASVLSLSLSLPVFAGLRGGPDIISPIQTFLRSVSESELFTPSPVIRKADYERHAAFQASFAVVPLGTEAESLDQVRYYRYRLGEDGLIDGISDSARGTHFLPGGEEIPPFPLEKLMDFLVDYNNRAGSHNPVDKPLDKREWLPILLIVLSALPFLFRRRNKDRSLRNLLGVQFRIIRALSPAGSRDNYFRHTIPGNKAGQRDA